MSNKEDEDSKQVDDITINQKPNTYLIWSLLNISLCFCSFFSLLFSIKALNYSFKTQYDLESGQHDKARLHSKLAFKFNLITNIFCIFGLFTLVLIFIFSDKILNYFIFKALIN